MGAKTKAARPATEETSFNNIVTLVASLKDLIKDGSVRIMTGPFGSALHAHEYIDCGVPVVPAEAICDDGRLDPSTFPRISKAKAEELSRYLLQEGDIVFARRGAQACGKSALVRSGQSGSISGTGLISLRVINRDRINNEYLAIALRSQESKDWLMHHAIGATMPNLNSSVIASLPLNLPTMRDQNAIAEIIQSLDDKIELNRRMNATLEAMARALFQSWLVDFDPVRAKLDGRVPVGMDAETAAMFPEHFDHKADGVVPTGWRATTLGEVIEISDSKRIPLSGREREARQGKYPYHGAASVMDYVDDFLFDGIYALMGEDGSVVDDDGTPVLQYVWGKFWVNNHAHVLRGKNGISTEHLLLHLKGCNIAPFVNGAVQPKLNQGNMNRIPFMLPPPEIGQAFARTIEPLFAQIRANTEQSRTLATLRDTLLPKLLNGELSTLKLENKTRHGCYQT